MLSRTADNLFWLARYTERADSTGRLLVFGRRLAMLPDGISGDDWRSVLRVAGCEGYVEPHAEVTEADAVAVLLLDPDNPSSIRASLDRARFNGRAVRTALTLEMWEALNDGWRRLERLNTERAVRDLPTLIDWVRGFVARFRGAVSTSMLRNEGYDFLRIGWASERASLTLRLLDVNYHLLLPEGEGPGQHRDLFRWTALLNTVAGLRAYYHLYRDNVKPWHIADFLLINRVFPRSLIFSVKQLGYHLDQLAEIHGSRVACHRSAALFEERLSRLRDGDIFQYGLHEFVEESLAELDRLNHQIAEAYHF